MNIANLLPQNVKDAYSISDSDSVSRYGDGHIHETYYVDGAGCGTMILQKINTHIFPHYAELMDNIELVTAHVAAKLSAAGKKSEEGTLTVINAKDGKPYFVASAEVDADPTVYRAYAFINGESRNQPSAPALLQAGKAFGEFQDMLADFPVHQLFETIPHFHDTPSRLKALEDAVKKDACGRVAECGELLALVRRLAWLSTLVTDAMACTEVPLRVTHNDTKLNNLLFRPGQNEVMAVIDLDTVMPGSLLYDFGDALRCGMSNAAEDEADREKIGVIMEHYEAFARGFISASCNKLTAKERELLPFSPLLMTYEVGVRFLTDYLSGDTYFHIAYPTHNLVRAWNQITLVLRMEEALPKMKEITQECINEYSHL